MKNLPTVPSAEAWPTRRTIDRAANLLDRVADDVKLMKKARKALARWDRPPLDEIEQARKATRLYENGTREKVISGAAEKLLNKCEPASWRDEDFNVRDCEVSKVLALLVASFPTSNVQNPKIFTRLMLEDVAALEPGFEVLDTACRELRTTKTFMPAIAEIVAAIEKHKNIWLDRWNVLDYAEVWYEELTEAITKSEAAIAAEEERRERQRKYREAMAAPLVVGDHVRHKAFPFGAGVTTKPSDDCEAWCVLFDNNQQEWIMASGLEKLVEGDKGFEPPSRPALAYQPAVPMPSWDDARPAAAPVAATPEPRRRVKE